MLEEKKKKNVTHRIGVVYAKTKNKKHDMRKKTTHGLIRHMPKNAKNEKASLRLGKERKQLRAHDSTMTTRPKA